MTEFVPYLVRPEAPWGLAVRVTVDYADPAAATALGRAWLDECSRLLAPQVRAALDVGCISAF